jgi:hypothetical protein
MLVPASIGFIAEQANVRLGLALLIGSYGAIALMVRRLSPDPYRRSAKAG